MAAVHFRLSNRDVQFSHLTNCNIWWLSNMAFRFIINADTFTVVNFTVTVNMISSITIALY
jgi:hypothetical protein